MKTAMIGDNCIDVYVHINGEVVNRRYPTGNCVDTGVNLQKLGIPCGAGGGAFFGTLCGLAALFLWKKIIDRDKI